MFSALPPRARRFVRLLAVSVLTVGLGAACGSGDDDDADPSGWVTVTTGGGTDGTDTSAPASESSVDGSAPATSARPTTSRPTSTTSSTSSTSSTSTTTTTIDPALVEHAFPVDPDVNSSFTPQAHANYQATDVFSSAGCGTRLVAPVTGTVDEVLPNTYDAAVDDPATRGGNAVSILGDDGVRYYLAHFQLIDPLVTPGAHVTAGQYLGEMGETGRVSACSLHFGLSLDCPGAVDDWWVRRGVIWPDAYLDSWRNGENLSPLPALQEWFTEYPDACRSVEDTPYPVA